MVNDARTPYQRVCEAIDHAQSPSDNGGEYNRLREMIARSSSDRKAELYELLRQKTIIGPR